MKLIECPRDAMQGMTDFIPTATKIAYINALLRVGFDTIDFGSFVSPKAIPQLRDTAEVLSGLTLDDTDTKLLAIIANTRGAEEAVTHEAITYLGFPFSISETFQQRNTRKSIAEALVTLQKIQELCVKHGKQQVAYISMGFGNPYGDPYDAEIVATYTEKLVAMGIEIISLADTIGVSHRESITSLYTHLLRTYPAVEFGAHLHSTPATAREKIAAAYEAGCRRFDGAINGYGGCPMAKDDLTGNIATEVILGYLDEQGVATGIDKEQFAACLVKAGPVFSV